MPPRNTLRSSQFLLFSSLVYVIGFAIGFTMPLNELYELPISPRLPDMPEICFLNLIRKNMLVIIWNLLGVITLGTSTVINTLLNGIILAVFIKIFIENGGRVFSVLLLTIPHCIFEIPAIIIAGAAGFKIPYEIICYLAGKKEQILTKEDIKEYLALALISIILIVIAAWIEANVTLRIAKTMLNSTKDV